MPKVKGAFWKTITKIKQQFGELFHHCNHTALVECQPIFFSLVGDIRQKLNEALSVNQTERSEQRKREVILSKLKDVVEKFDCMVPIKEGGVGNSTSKKGSKAVKGGNASKSMRFSKTLALNGLVAITDVSSDLSALRCPIAEPLKKKRNKSNKDSSLILLSSEEDKD